MFLRIIKIQILVKFNENCVENSTLNTDLN